MSDESIPWPSSRWPAGGWDGYTLEMFEQHKDDMRAGGCEYRVWSRKCSGNAWHKNHMTAPTMQRLEASISHAIKNGYELMGEIEVFRYSQEEE